MDLARHPDLLDRIAASYALGTLRGGARRRFEAVARQSPTVRTAAMLWQERLVSLMELQPSQAPDPNVWKRIENVLAAERQPQAPPAPRRRWWPVLALGGALATVVAVSVAVKLAGDVDQRDAELAQLRQQGTQLAQRNAQLLAQLQAQPDIRYVAVLADDKQSASMLALFDPKHNTLTLKRVGGYQEAADKSLQLWALTEGGPRSMGVLGTDAVMKLAAVEQQLRQSPALAVSLEPKGGVPGEGGPTGPVLFKGAVLQAPL
ncbi:MAG: anti-sigma factor [Burkholderiales bacterium]|nr:anti-sigma factor [Burkholderiales bacterium]